MAFQMTERRWKIIAFFLIALTVSGFMIYFGQDPLQAIMDGIKGAGQTAPAAPAAPLTQPLTKFRTSMSAALPPGVPSDEMRRVGGVFRRVLDMIRKGNQAVSDPDSVLAASNAGLVAVLPEGEREKWLPFSAELASALAEYDRASGLKTADDFVAPWGVLVELLSPGG